MATINTPIIIDDDDDHEPEPIANQPTKKRRHDELRALTLKDALGLVPNKGTVFGGGTTRDRDHTLGPLLPSLRAETLRRLNDLCTKVENTITPAIWADAVAVFALLPTITTFGELQTVSKRVAALHEAICKYQPSHFVQRVIFHGLDTLTAAAPPSALTVRQFVVQALFTYPTQHLTDYLAHADTQALCNLQSPLAFFTELLEIQEKDSCNHSLPLSPLKECLFEKANITIHDDGKRVFTELAWRDQKKISLSTRTDPVLPTVAINRWIDTYAATLLAEPHMRQFATAARTCVRTQCAGVEDKSKEYKLLPAIMAEIHRLLFDLVNAGVIKMDDVNTSPADYFDLRKALLDAQ